MERIFASPSRYVQGKGVLKHGLSHIKDLGKKVLLLTDETVWKIAGEELFENLKAAELEPAKEIFGGEASANEIDRIVSKAKSESIEVIAALGGGKAIDTGKAVADELKIPIAVLPTIASTDAPTSALSVIYTDEGRFEKYRFYNKNPELVLVDTAVIAKAPAKLLAAGIADALATYVEARAVARSHSKNMVGGVQPIASMAIAEKCEEILFENALKAYQANKKQVVTEAFEQIVEANTLLSGLGFESAGLAAAHAIHNGLTALEGDVHDLTHGEKVAYGTLTQLMLENADPEELDQYIELYQALELPTTLSDMHLAEASDADLLKIGEQATIEGETIHNMPFPVSAEDVAAAIKAVDAYVSAYYPL
ncbi:glycerol dehydrogenase [Enterococcus casseliflavus]|uniref:glycerol dehydrogenase n=1 Tax=Enterococcus casseliflavus TaxID=37734 RepID=UPI001C8B9C09|nr:glycerol dehydrogenase [Enterococcus casseliflavus]MBX9116356.1 glycerol dehydrogenase [Enterococcus casseliflavus]MBX9126677.1 glycerol dehydrogenase [Enterococcus casseliflavus]